MVTYRITMKVVNWPTFRGRTGLCHNDQLSRTSLLVKAALCLRHWEGSTRYDTEEQTLSWWLLRSALPLLPPLMGGMAVGGWA